MHPHSRLEKRSNEPLDGTSHKGRGGGMAMSARHVLLDDFWAEDVKALESAIARFQVDPRSTNNCDIVFFEIVDDDCLHVNVTHRYPTKAVSGWAGPGLVPQGFVHNRRFGETPQDEMIRHIREMVFATPI